MNLGRLDLSLAGARRGGGSAFTLPGLFSDGTDGLLLPDFVDLTRQFLLPTGSTGNIAADTDPAGLETDTHSWGQTLAQVLAAQPELVSNPGNPFAATTGYTMVGGSLTVVGGALTVSNVTSNTKFAFIPITVVVGKTYKVVVSYSSGDLPFIGVGSASSGAASFDMGSVSPSGFGNATLIFVASATTAYIRVGPASSTSTLVSGFGAISCKLVAGNHARQATTTKRPLWRANSGKPYLQTDGSDDILVSPFIPTAACTFGIACRITNASTIMLGGETARATNAGTSASMPQVI